MDLNSDLGKDGFEEHATVLDFKDFDWATASDHAFVNFAKTLDLPERGIPRSECYLLLEALRAARRPATILETGMFYGTSTRIFIAWTIRYGGKVYTCETAVRDLFRDRMRRGGYWELVNPMGDSLSLVWDKGPIDFLFIDSGHAFKYAWGEYERFSPFLTEGSIVGWHDTITREGGVRPAISKALEQDTLKFVCGSEESGVGIEFYRFIRKGA